MSQTAIRLVRAAIMNEEIAQQHELNDEEVLAIIRREVGQHKESLSIFEKAGREDLVAAERAQLQCLEAYLPQQMSREEITQAAQEAIAETGASDVRHLGQVMRVLMPRLRNRADGGTINQIVRDVLSHQG